MHPEQENLPRVSLRDPDDSIQQWHNEQQSESISASNDPVFQFIQFVSLTNFETSNI